MAQDKNDDDLYLPADLWLWHEVAQEFDPLDDEDRFASLADMLGAPKNDGDKNFKTQITPETKPSKVPRNSKNLHPQPDAQTGAFSVDGATHRKLKRGRIPIDMRIDLHGKSQIQAQDYLRNRIQSAFQQGLRCILVITGKGSLRQPSILREKMPQWLTTPPLRSIVLKYAVAQKHHGGQGAFYIYLRRHR